MSLRLIPNQPLNFLPTALIASCPDRDIPLRLEDTDNLIFQFGVDVCEGATNLLLPLTANDWITDGGWSFNDGACGVVNNGLAFIQESNWTPTEGAFYAVRLVVDSVQGDGVFVSFGGFQRLVNTPGVVEFVGQSIGNLPLRVTLVSDSSAICLSAVEVYAFGEDWSVKIEGCDGGYPVEYTIGANPEYFQVGDASVTAIIPTADIGEDRFRVVLVDVCNEEEYCSPIVTVGDCGARQLVRVCLDEDALGFSAGRFDVRLALALIRPTFTYDVAEERLANGRRVRNYADREERWTLRIETVPDWLHPFIGAWVLFDHLYIGTTEWMVETGDYSPEYGDGQTGNGVVQIIVRPKEQLVRRVKCGAEGEGCNPKDDPICPEANATITTQFSGGDLFVRVDILSFVGFEVERIDWTLNGVPQTDVGTPTPGPYALGPVQVGDVVTVTFVNRQDVACNDARAAFTVELPPCTGLQVEALGGALYYATGSDGYSTVVGPSGAVITEENAMFTAGSFFDLQDGDGTYCIYASDEFGQPSGHFIGLGIGGNIQQITWGSVIGQPAFTDTDNPGLSIAIDGPSVVTLPLVVGTSSSLFIDDANTSAITQIIVPPGNKYAWMDVSAPAIDSASVDALCNALDPTVTGQTTQFAGTAAATAASLANRNAYIANGNTITFTA